MPPSVRRDLQLERFGFKLLPLGQGYLPMRGGGSIMQHTDEKIDVGLDREAVQARRRRVLRVLRVDRRASPNILGPMLMETPPHVGSKKPRRPVGPGQARVEAPQARRRGTTVGDITRLFTMSATDLLERWFETPADDRVHVGERDHRHVGRPRRARDRVRPDAPLGRRHRRRGGRDLGIHRGRHGRRRRRRARRAREFFGAEVRVDARCRAR